MLIASTLCLDFKDIPAKFRYQDKANCKDAVGSTAKPRGYDQAPLNGVTNQLGRIDLETGTLGSRAAIDAYI